MEGTPSKGRPERRESAGFWRAECDEAWGRVRATSKVADASGGEKKAESCFGSGFAQNNSIISHIVNSLRNTCPWCL